MAVFAVLRRGLRTHLLSSVCPSWPLIRIAAFALPVVLAGSVAPTIAVRAQDALTDALRSRIDPSTPMLLEASELHYDFDRDIISAVGTVQIYYGEYTVEADRVDYDRRNARLVARGDVRMTEPDGNVITAQELTLSEDMREGFASALQVDTPQRTRFLADSAERGDGNITTFSNGLYTVYTRPTTPPDKPPLWRIRAARIIHNQEERMIYYEGASFEFFGQSIAYLPYLSMPDPSVRRKSGFLMPSGVYRERLGVGVTVPYYFALNPHYDLLVQATPLTRQSGLLQGEWRQRLINGSYSIQAGGIFQSDPDAFNGSSGDRRFRGVVASTGDFNIDERWRWGWNLSYRSDRAFLEDYDFTRFGNAGDVSNIYLTGQSERNRFDIVAYAFRISQEDYDSSADGHDAVGFSPVGSDLQEKQPFVHPVIDYDYIFEDPIAGGELSITANLTSLTRDETDALTVAGVNRYRGVEGTFTRATLEAEWRRTLIDPFGQVFTPFAYLKGDMYFLASQDQKVSQLTDEAVVGRVMPAVGLEYRYPFVATFEGGNQIVAPIAQVIVRPDEQRIGDVPNEDAQSIVFDTTTLFDYDKFSGFDRSEGGTRANIGLSYKLQADNGSYISALFGRSFHLAGTNSFSKPDILDATGDSGLDTSQSDYVSSILFDTAFGFRLGAEARFDKDDFSVQRAQIQGSGIYGPVTGGLAYAYLDEQPDLGIDEPREEVIGSTSVRLQENWRLFGSIRYDLENSNIVQNAIGLGYDDEGFSISVSYAEDRSRNNGEPTDKLFFLRFGLRTIGDSEVSSGSIE